ncbi:hypothetical protein [Caldisalinibacter kiritimatiensis]|uniref:Uncharacterized protein n=1 Tax=Caldisalinibacter kiritimatiensis TaxID=1304284 RepID=R1CRQ9_9FIRM|nr:hypothetical protein [Caldisalinibacter kiritimatiensis]EOC99388.1 hypothetical protein L21TH_2646 [Caldisalinibacter kiritimatiensis]
MEDTLKQILDKLNSIETEINGIKTEINDLKQGQQKIDEKLTETYEQVVRNTESIEAGNIKLSKISNSIDYLKYKESQHEEELFTIKKNFIEVIK